jgi:copper(I)-binding protein
MPRFRIVLPALLAAALLAQAGAANAQVNVNLPWVRATTQKSAQVFMQIEAHAAAGVALIGASSSMAKTAAIVDARGRGASRIEVAAGTKVVLKPGGPHVLLSGLTQKLRKGDRVPLNLTFEVPGGVPLVVGIHAEVVGAHDKTAIDHEKQHVHQH